MAAYSPPMPKPVRNRKRKNHHAWKETAGRLSLRVLLVGLPLLVATQIGLGVWSITTFLAVEPVTLHLAVAALIFASLVILAFVSRGVGSSSAPSPVVRA